jgi:hypothetical protein
MKPFLAINTDVDILRFQPFNKRLPVLGWMHSKAAGASLAYPLRLLLLALAFHCDVAWSTTVLAIRTPEILVVGADSLSRVGTGDETQLSCKIKRYGKFYAAFAGVSNDGDTKFDVSAIAATAMVPCDSIDCAVANFKRDVALPLLGAVFVSRKRDGVEFFTERFIKAAPLQALIFGVSGEVSVRMINFTLDMQKWPTKLGLKIEDDGGCPGTCGPQGIALYGIGSFFSAAKFGLARYVKDPERAIAEALATEATANPKAVGPPFSILVMEGTSTRWQDGYQGVCPAIEK